MTPALILPSDPRAGSGTAARIGTIAVNSAGTSAYQKVGAGATDWALISPANARQKYTRLGLALTGLTEWGDLWEDFDAAYAATVAPANWQKITTTSGSTLSAVPGTKGGVSRLRSGATAGSGEDHLTGAALLHQGTDAWYYACRQRIPTAVDAQCRAGGGLSSVLGNSIVAGFRGPSDAVNFGVAYDSLGVQANLSLAVAVDTSWHIFEVWCTGDSVLRARLDGGATVTATMLSAGAEAYVHHIVRNGTTATDRHLDRDWCLCLYPRGS